MAVQIGWEWVWVGSRVHARYSDTSVAHYERVLFYERITSCSRNGYILPVLRYQNAAPCRTDMVIARHVAERRIAQDVVLENTCSEC